MKNIKIQIMYSIVLIGVLTATAPVWAHLPDQRQMAHVASLAHQLESAAQRVHVAAKRSAHHNSRGENYALRKLRNFGHEAREFHRDVERRHRQPLQTLDDFGGLIRSFREAKYAFQYLHASSHVRSEFDRVERLVFEISDYYGGRYHRPSTHRHGYQSWNPYGDHH